LSTNKSDLKKKLNENLPDTYESYLAKEGVLAKEGGLELLSEGKAAEKFESTNFGDKSEKLAKLGLDGSGYEDYLLAQSANQAKARRNASLLFKETADYENRSAYAKYLSDYESLQEKISNSVIASVKENLNFNVDEAYRLAVNSGLSESYATETAKSAVSQAKRAAVQKAIAYADEKGLSALKAKDYAKSLGLDGKYLEEVYDAVSYLDYEQKRYFSSLSTKEYISYLKEQANKRTE
jgi:hypothetical protein